MQHLLPRCGAADDANIQLDPTLLDDVIALVNPKSGGQKGKQVFEPLIEQLCERGAYIMKRLPNLAFSTLEARKDRNVRGRGGDSLFAMKGYHYFCFTIRDIFYDYVERTTNICKQKCEDELRCTDLLYFELSNSKPELFSNDFHELANSLFIEQRDIVSQNILLKCHHYFNVELARNLSGVVLKEVSALEDKRLEQMFQMTRVKEQLKIEEQLETLNIDSYSDKEHQLRDFTNQFSRFRLVATD